MQTDPNAVRYMVSERGSTVTNLQNSMRIFDCMEDVVEYLRTKIRVDGPLAANWGPKYAGKMRNTFTGSFKLFEMSPVKCPKKLTVSHKLIGIQEYFDA